MIDRVRSLVARLSELEQSLQDPEVFSDPKKVAQAGKELKRLEPLKAFLEEYDRLVAEKPSLVALSFDADLGPDAKAELERIEIRLPELEKKMRTFLLPIDPDDEKSVIIEVRAGAGGEEAALFAAQLLRMYLRYAEEHKWKAEIIDTSGADAGGIKEASARIEGNGVYGALKYESGVHRVQRIPETEAKGRVHTSTATVAILPEAEEVDIVIKNEDLRIDTFRSGGAGGQNVNKVESAIRITHIPTNTVVACQTERSQLQNRQRAMTLLRSRLYAAEQERLAKERGQLRSGQIGTGDRSEKIRTYNFPQDRLTDHRINENFSNLPAIMEGDLDNIVLSLKHADEEAKLQAL